MADREYPPKTASKPEPAPEPKSFSRGDRVFCRTTKDGAPVTVTGTVVAVLGEQIRIEGATEWYHVSRCDLCPT